MKKTQMVRMMLVEDNREYREAIEFAFETESDVELLGPFASAEMAIGSIQNCSADEFPDIILLDLRLPGVGGLEAIPFFRDKVPSAKIIILSQSDAEADVLHAITLGASGYLLKSSKVPQIKEAVRTVYAGGAIIDPKVAQFLLNKLKGNPMKALSPQLLSEREFEILSLLAEGLQKKEIGNQLNISYPTVDSHVRHIYDKLDAKNAPAAVKKAYQIGLFSD